MRSNHHAERGPGGGIEPVNLTKTYDRAPVLKGINLTIERGEFFSLLGPNGCGNGSPLCGAEGETGDAYVPPEAIRVLAG